MVETYQIRDRSIAAIAQTWKNDLQNPALAENTRSPNDSMKSESTAVKAMSSAAGLYRLQKFI
jgi:hypothetical protein